jgi:2-iminobutanoate/2-iminopropanoate deaminase
MKETVTAQELAPAIGPYSHAVKAGGFLFVSGQLPLDRSGNFAGDDIKSQTEQALKNLKAVLEAAGAGPENVVKTTVFLADIADFAAMNEVYKTFFVSGCPARSAVQVAALPRSALVEIEAVAAL